MKKSNLILGFYLGVITLCVATVSMSIAWYASSTQVRIEGLVMTVDCDRELWISTAKDGEFVEKLEPEQLHQVKTFSPVTAAHSDRWLNNKSDMPVFYDETKYSTYEYADLVTVANRGYFSQKLYLLSDDDVYVTIDPAGTSIEAQMGSETPQAKQLAKAMRYSILITDQEEYNYAIIDPNKETDTLFAGILDNDKDKFFDYYVTDSGSYERLYGEYEGTPDYGEASNQDSELVRPNEDPDAFNAKHRRGVKPVILEENENFKIKREPSIGLDEFNQEVKPFRIPVYRNKPQEIVLSLYIEGWDLDSINFTKGADFQSSIQFKIEREM